MKYAKKLMLVPFVNKSTDPIELYLENLDNEMRIILERKDLSITEKLKLYNQALQKYLNTSKEDLNDKEIKLRHHNVTETTKHEPIKKEIVKKIVLKAKRIGAKKTKNETQKKKEIINNHLSKLLDEKMVIDESKDNLDINEPRTTRSVAKQFNIPLLGDPSWRLSGKGLLNKKFVWKTRQFF